jgi:hypothetical protein
MARFAGAAPESIKFEANLPKTAGPGFARSIRFCVRPNASAAQQAHTCGLSRVAYMFFVKLAFWLGVVVMLLPSDEQQQARFYTTATTAVERATTFCDRNPRTCTMGAEAWSTFLRKAEFAARLVGDMVNSSARRSGLDGSPPPPQKMSGTLSPMDMQPTWRGPNGGVGS